MKPVVLTLLLVVCVAAAGLIVAEAAEAKIHAPPTAPCGQSNRMDLVITDDGVWFECVCEYLMIGVVCDWYELGPAPDAAAARRRWNYVRPSMQRQLFAQHRWPRFLSWRLAAKPAPVKIVATPTGTVTTGLCNDPYLADDAWAQAHGC